MSVRTEQPGQQQLNLSVQAPMGVSTGAVSEVAATIDAAQAADHALGGENTFNASNPEHPLNRTVVVTVRASLNDLCLRKQKAVWAPSADAIRSILQQRKFTDLSGSTEAQGDLKSVVLHKLSIDAQKSTFPVAIGAKITGVDDATYSITGEAFSTVVLPHADSHTSQTLQADDVSLAYEFARKFPGYTAENLSEKGIHEVQARRFCLVAADHPLVSAISENAEKLQMGEIAMMPEGLVKISSSLYETILPMVKQQVETQIKVRDMSRTQVSIAPAEFASWSDARAELMSEAKAGLKSRLEAELGAAGSEADLAAIKATFSADERALEQEIDNTVHTFSCKLNLDYNFLSK